MRLTDTQERKRIAVMALEAHNEIQKATARNPHLRRNPAWQALCDTAAARFRAAFEAM